MKRLLLTGTLVAMLAACNNPSPPQANPNDMPMRDQFFGVGPVNHKWTRSGEGIRYNYDTNQNPQSIRNLSDQQLSISDDQDKIRHLVQTESDFEPGMVAIVGNRAYVHVRTGKNVTDDEVNNLHDKLQKAMPRYTIRLMMQD